MKKNPFNFINEYSNLPLEIFHMDVWGSVSNLSIKGHKYYLLIINEVSKFSWFFSLYQKNEVFQTFCDFHKMIENFLDHKIKILRTDSEGEFLNQKFVNFCKKFGIQQRYSSPYTPTQNGLVERKHGHIINITRCFFI